MCDSTGRQCSEERPSLDESRPVVVLFIITSSKEPHLGRSLLSCRMMNVNISSLFVSELSALSKHRPPDYTAIKLKFHPYFYTPPPPPPCSPLSYKGQINLGGSVPSGLLPCSSLMAKDERVIFRVSWGSLVRHTRMAASGTHARTSYLSSVIVCKAAPHH